ncbi:MAG: aminotransferase class IV [Armatimonadetes bacterium]|nr:aminotransferase class IV [Armatimonadota bacterium]
MSERLVYINGEYFAEPDAKISIFDSAVQLGDTATESTRTFLQKPFKLEEHVTRLYDSLKIMRIDPGMTADEMVRVTLEVAERNFPAYGPDEDIWIVHNVSRGGYFPSGDPSARRTATIIIHTAPMNLDYWAEFFVRGCHAVTPMSRMTPAQSLDPKIKNRSRLPYTLAELEVKLVDPRAQGIILDVDGFLCENKGGNFFVAKDGIVRTPPPWNALDGITRRTTIDIARSKGIPVEVCPLQPYDVYVADEAFFTSTPYCIMPATRFNGLPVGDGKVGPIAKALLDGWSEIAGFDIVDKALRNLEPPLRDELLAERGR